MTTDECVRLLHTGVMGRVAMTTGTGPRIVPVHYVMHGDDIVFRAAPHSQLGSYGANCELAFEVDDFDHDLHRGWSVVAVGRSAVIEDHEVLETLRERWEPTTWVGGHRHVYLRLRWRELAGRRVGARLDAG